MNRAADLMQLVPENDHTYSQLRQLEHFGILSNGEERLHDEKAQHLTRYDVAFLLIEPLERCIALVQVQENPTAQPEQRQRAELAYLAVSKLSPEEFETLLSTMRQLLGTYGEDIEKLSAGLSVNANTALRKLAQPNFRPWEKNTDSTPDTLPTIHITINPHATQDTMSAPLPLFAQISGGRTTMCLASTAPASGSGGESSKSSAILSKPMSSLEAAVDVAFGRFHLYGSLATLPSGDPTQSLLKPDGSGQAMLGLKVGIMQIRNLGISGILQYQVVRSGDPTNPDMNTSLGGGIGLSW